MANCIQVTQPVRRNMDETWSRTVRWLMPSMDAMVFLLSPCDSRSKTSISLEL
jgi:hypothetical protein